MFLSSFFMPPETASEIMARHTARSMLQLAQKVDAELKAALQPKETPMNPSDLRTALKNLVADADRTVIAEREAASLRSKLAATEATCAAWRDTANRTATRLGDLIREQAVLRTKEEREIMALKIQVANLTETKNALVGRLEASQATLRRAATPSYYNAPPWARA